VTLFQREGLVKQENTHWVASQVGKDYAKVGWRSYPPTLEAGKHLPVKKGESFLSNLHMPHIFGSLSVNSQEQPKVDVGILIDTCASDSFIWNTSSSRKTV
jgi:hypothetical protein